jgi:cellulose synthase/poly-beta-1,6-N-acetylglucosamine synthase-like glycosyltransferase
MSQSSRRNTRIRASIIITAFREASTVGQALEAFLRQLPEPGPPASAEVLVVCPDPETRAVADGYAAECPIVRQISDPQRGKPTAVNVGLQAARGEIVVLSDGDVVIDENALEPLLAPFRDPRVGAVSGHPVSVNGRDTALGYWSHLLTDSIHAMRLRRRDEGRFLLCSGYLFAFRRELIDGVPSDALAEDAVVSHRIAKQGYRIGYAPEARVYVRYPATYGDWLRQKTRSAGGYAQEYVRASPFRMRSAWLELKSGTIMALRYPRSGREFLWTLLLFAARLHLWLRVLFQVRMRKLPLGELWKRVESTK